MNETPLTRISSPAPEICPNVLLTGNVFYTESIPILPRPNKIHGHSGRQHPSGL